MLTPSPTEIIADMTYPGARWPGPEITFSIPVAGSTWPGYPGATGEYPPRYGNEPLEPDYSVLSQVQADSFRVAVAAWQRLIATPIVETDDLTGPGEIRVAFTNTASYGGYTYYPPFNVPTIGPTDGDVWLSSFNKTWNYQIGWDLAAGQSPSPIMLHELGHALGLKHPFEAPNTVPPEFDSIRYSVMSYNFTNFGEATLTFSYSGDELLPDSRNAWVDMPMVFDILAIQSLYGANPNTAAGDTSYTFTETKSFFQSIYDANGTDTIDLSSHHRPSIIDLTPGAYSSIDTISADEQIAKWTAALPARFTPEITAWITKFSVLGFLYTGHDNLGIAYSTTIERAFGGSGDDTITGNEVGNVLLGGAGRDQILGAGGGDFIEGGAGQNYLRGGDGDDQITGGADFDDANGNTGDDRIWAGAGDDWAVGGKDNDDLSGEAGNDVVWGNLGADTGTGGDGNDQVRGGQGDDSVSGGAGDDFVSGDRGADTISGGSGADLFHGSQDAGVDRVLDFNRTEGDRVQLDPGTTYTLSQVGADTVIDMGGGHQMILVGVEMSTLAGNWVFLV